MYIQEWLLNSWTQESWEALIDAIPIIDWQILLEERNKEECLKKVNTPRMGEKMQITVNMHETTV